MIPGRVVPGVTYRQLSSESTDPAYLVRYAVVPGADALNTAVETAAQARLVRFVAESGQGEGTGAELHVNVQVIASGGGLVAERLTALTPEGAKGSVTHQTWYASSTDNWVIESRELIAEKHQKAFADLVVERARRQLSADAYVDRGLTPAEVLRDVTVNAGGGLTVVLDQGLLGALTEGTQYAELTSAEIEPLLSPRGRQVLAALPPVAPTPTSEPPPSPTPSSTPSAPVSTQPASGVDCAVTKCVALTFDDGPGIYTARLLDELKAARAPATFFMLGQNAQAHPDLVRRAAAEGHQIGNHTVDHRSLDRLSLAQQRWEVDTAAAVLRRLSGQPVTLLRPPYGAYDASTRTLGVPLILWDVDTEDWKNRDAAVTTRRALATVRPGSIILLHDIHQSSVAATPGIVQALRKRGLTLVTVSDLLGPLRPGAVSTRR